MKIIDAHVHFSRIAVFSDTARLYSGVDYSASGLTRECMECGIVKAIGMGVTESSPYAFPDGDAAVPMDCDLPGKPPILAVCPGINPFHLDTDALEHALRDPITAGIKIYAGYYPFYPDDKVYEPVYALAQACRKPVVIHSGDTYSERGLLEYAHPLRIDRLAVRYPDISFIIAHLGDPWVMDACEVAYKNKNVYLDLSGLIVGDEEEVSRVMNEPLLVDRYRQGLIYLNNYDKVLFGTDWPLVAMKPYIEFCKALTPADTWPRVFYENAVQVFGMCVQEI